MAAKKGSTGKNKPAPKTSGSDYRRADTGQYTTERYAKTHPKTTVKETRKGK